MRWLLAVAIVALGACDEPGEAGAGKPAPPAPAVDEEDEAQGGESGEIEAHGYVLVDGDFMMRTDGGRVGTGVLAEAARVGAYDVPKGTHLAFDDEGRPTRMYHPDETLQIGPYPSAPDAIVELTPGGRATLFCLAEDRRIGDNYYAAGTALTLEADGSVGRPYITYYTHPDRDPKVLRVHLPHELGCPPDGRSEEGAPSDPNPELDRERWRARMRGAVKSELPELDPCFARARDHALEGLLVWLQVDESGKVTAVDVAPEDAEGLASCVDGKVRRWSFDVGDALGADISVAFALDDCDGALACMDAGKAQVR